MPFSLPLKAARCTPSKANRFNASSSRRWNSLPVVACRPRHPPTLPYRAAIAGCAKTPTVSIPTGQGWEEGAGCQALALVTSQHPSLSQGLDFTFCTVAAFAIKNTHWFCPRGLPQSIARPGTTCRISTSCASPVPPGSSAVRGSHVNRELLSVITPPVSMSGHRYAYPYRRCRLHRFQSREIPKPVTYPT